MNGPSVNWFPLVWGLSTQEQKGLLGPSLPAGWSRQAQHRDSCCSGDQQPGHLVTLVEAQDLSGGSVWGHPSFTVILNHPTPSQGANTCRHAHCNALVLSRSGLVVPQPFCGKSMKPLKTLSASEPL